MLKIREISPELQKIAKDELNEIPERIANDLDALREWIRKTPHLKARTDDQFLLGFLRGCKYHMEKVKHTIDMFYSVRTGLPELMMNRDPLDPDLRDVIKLGVGLPLPVLESPGSPRVLLIRIGAFDPTVHTMVEVFKVANMINDILIIKDDNFVISGTITIVDFKDITKQHLLQLNPLLLKKLAFMNQEANPFRSRGLHFTNTPPGFDVIFNLFKSLLPSNSRKEEEDLLEIFIHPTSTETLFDHIPKTVLPNEYGGEGGSIETIVKNWEEKLISHRDFFLEESSEKYGTDENKREKKLHNTDIFPSTSGSFRQLDID